MGEPSDFLWEHIRSLQAQIDHLRNLDDARLDRIARLERDREVLRQRLDRATRRRWGRNGDDEAIAPPTEKPALEVASVGLISEPELKPVTPARDLRVATVLDVFSSLAFGPEFAAVPVGARTWQEELKEGPPDLLLVESAYSGHDGSWANRIARFGEPSRHLRELVEWCRKRGIPTAFWNKEDPINYDWFIESACLFDAVFTVDGDQIPRYRSELGHDRVHLLKFFAQPHIHYPGPEKDRLGTVAFAGSYYAAKHPERREQMEMLLDPAREFGLHIFDRHGHTDDPRFAWPGKYRPHIMGRLTYLQTVEAYRRYKVFLNVNTVTDSPTMCARRVFELAACGTPIVTGPSKALARAMPSDAITQVVDVAGTKAGLQRLLHDPDERIEMAATAHKWVMDNHTASHRIDEVIDVIGR